jgi:hypothetical protein
MFTGKGSRLIKRASTVGLEIPVTEAKKIAEISSGPTPA